jgi:molecular chaperone IbpA
MEDADVRALDLSPLFRQTVGFDRFDRLFDQVFRVDSPPVGYPPYNIEKQGDDKYRITMAVAGFKDEDIDVVVENGTLTVKGAVKQKTETDHVNYLHRGIAERAFERRFALADTIKVTEAKLENGLLHIDLVREVPEERKPRQIKIAKAA